MEGKVIKVEGRRLKVEGGSIYYITNHETLILSQEAQISKY